MNDVQEALVMEINLRSNYLKSAEEKPILKTIYFGGGTPSLFNNTQLNNIFSEINKHYLVDEGAEITLEANPDDLTPEKLSELKQTPINRLSIGVQSFFEDDLKIMNRAHTAEMAKKSVLAAAEAGFNNITIDLIYGMPGMSEEKWKQNLDIAFSLPVQHLSCYSLTVEKKTALEKMIRDGQVPPVDDDNSANHFKILMQAAVSNGFDHYEISNFAKPGYNSRHNSSYWKDEYYIGIGPSAHSYNGISRQWNIASNSAYIAAIKKGVVPAETEILSTENHYNEYLMTGLRTKWGVDLNFIRIHFGETFAVNFLTQMQQYIQSGDLVFLEEIYTLSEKGKLIADRITAGAFIV